MCYVVSWACGKFPKEGKLIGSFIIKQINEFIGEQLNTKYNGSSYLHRDMKSLTLLPRLFMPACFSE